MPERRKRLQADEAKSSAVALKTPYSVHLDDALLVELRQWPKEDRKRIGNSIRRVQENFGQPHLHSGIGIRDLSPKGRRLWVIRVSRKPCAAVGFHTRAPLAALFSHDRDTQ